IKSIMLFLEKQSFFRLRVEFKIGQGDLYYFEKKEAYYIIGDNLRVCVINSPKWNLEQYKLIKDK
ncbi:MAG: hypothetical protein WC157_00940, partial [Candidatus Paceibacterota bacterium]